MSWQFLFQGSWVPISLEFLDDLWIPNVFIYNLKSFESIAVLKRLAGKNGYSDAIEPNKNRVMTILWTLGDYGKNRVPSQHGNGVPNVPPEQNSSRPVLSCCNQAKTPRNQQQAVLHIS
jgi:hypothetical protein